MHGLLYFVSANADEILWASTDYVNEGIEHERKDGIGDFARGQVLMSISGNGYKADVVIAKRKDGSLMLYDVTHIEPENLQKKETAERSGSSKSVPTSQSAASNTSIADANTDVNTQSMQNQQLSLPSQNLLRQEIAAWRGARRSEGARRERQFASQTAQRSEAMPDWLKQELFGNPQQRYYDADTNNDQLMRAWERIQQGGYEAERDRLLDTENFTTEDNAEANVIMAFRNGDVNTALEMQNADPNRPVGECWTMEEVKEIVRKMGLPMTEKKLIEFYAVINAMYSDYYKVAEKFDLMEDDFFACMAKAFIEDEDAVKDKAAAYYQYIVKKD